MSSRRPTPTPPTGSPLALRKRDNSPHTPQSPVENEPPGTPVPADTAPHTPVQQIGESPDSTDDLVALEYENSESEIDLEDEE